MRVRSGIANLLGVLAVAWVAVASLASHAAAPLTLAGTWAAGPLSEVVTVNSWVDECGARPTSNSSGATTYKITKVGDELSFAGPSNYRTDGCWDQGTARRVAHSATPSVRWWKTRCESPPGDPRKTTITTVLRATDDDTLVFSESAHYEVTVSAGVCSADVERSRTFKITAREGGGGPSVPATASVASSVPALSTSTPPKRICPRDGGGEPVALQVAPRKKLLRPGEQFEFRGRVVDADGCDVAKTVSFRLAQQSSALATSITVDTSGRVRVRADAEPAIASISAEGAGKTAIVTLEVVTDKRNAELLGNGELSDAGADESAVAVTITEGGHGADGGTRVVGSASTVSDVGDAGGKRQRYALIVIVAGAFLLAAVGMFVLSRRRPTASSTEGFSSTPGPLPIAPSSPPPHQDHRAEVIRSGAPPSAAPVPMPEPPSAATAGPGKICPVCGRRYRREAEFCGDDGVVLVPVN